VVVKKKGGWSFGEGKVEERRTDEKGGREKIER